MICMFPLKSKSKVQSPKSNVESYRSQVKQARFNIALGFLTLDRRPSTLDFGPSTFDLRLLNPSSLVLFDQMVTGARGQRHDGDRRVLARRCRITGSVHDKQIAYL